LNLGVDIEEVERFSKNKYEDRKTFYEKIFTQNEIKYCLSKANPHLHFAVRFCAKEAAIKAMDKQKISLLDIEIKITENKPTITLPFEMKGIVSMSHTKNLAIATVLIF
jgi:holo-[acyl-carrier protein] synthase